MTRVCGRALVRVSFAVCLLCHCAGGQVAPAAPAHQARSVSLYPVLGGKGEPLHASELSITDAGRLIEGREVEVSPAGAGDPRPVAFLFDRLEPASEKNAAHIAQGVVREAGGHPGMYGLWSIRTELTMNAGFTPDREAVLEALRDLAGLKPATPGRTALPFAGGGGVEQIRLRTAADGIDETARRTVRERHVRWGVATLLAMAEAMRPADGRKVIVYFVEKSSNDVNAVEDWKLVSQSLNAAGVTLFVVDPNPMDGGLGTQQAVTMTMGVQARTDFAAHVAALQDHNPLDVRNLTMGLGNTNYNRMLDTVSQLGLSAPDGNSDLQAQTAAATGGTALSSDEGSKRLARAVVANLTNYYKVSYPLSAERLDGKYHPVLLKVTRPRAVEVVHAGYFPPSAMDAEARLHRRGGTETSELERLGSESTGTDLTLHGAVLRFGMVHTGVREVVALEVPVGELEARSDRNAGLLSAHASLAAEIRDESGAPLARFAEEFRPHGALSAETAFRAEVLSLSRAANLPPGKYALVATVRDWNSGRTGTLERRFEALPSQREEALSDVVLVRSTEPSEGGPAGANGAALQYGHLRVVPNLSGEVVEAAHSASMFFELYPQEKESKDRSLFLEVSYGDKPPVKIPLRLRSGSSREASAQVATVKLPTISGPVHVSVCLEGDGRVDRRELTFQSAGTAGSPVGEHPEAGGVDVAEDQPRAELFNLGAETESTAPLGSAEQAALIASARQNAMTYGDGLPNFLCVEAIDRAGDAKGTGAWKHLDSIVEVLRYQDRSEKRTVVEVNGQKSSPPADRIEGARSNGEFGSLLHTIFDPAAQASFTWQRTQAVDGGTQQVFAYKVAADHSNFFVSDRSGDKRRSALQGLVFVDGQTRAVRRLVAQTEGLPATFGVRSSWMAMNYDYVAINNHDYLLPTRGEVGLIQGKRQVTRNELRFRDYRRFGSKVKIRYAGEELAGEP